MTDLPNTFLASALPTRAKYEASLHLSEADRGAVEEAVRSMHVAAAADAANTTGTDCTVCCSAPRCVRMRPCGHAACCMPCTVKLISRDTTNRTIRHTCVLCRANVDTLEVSVAPAADDTTAPPSVVRMPSAPQPMLSTAVACTPRELLENLARCGEDGGGELAAAAKSALNKLSMRPTPGCRRPGSAPASQLGFRVRARVRVLRRLSA